MRAFGKSPNQLGGSATQIPVPNLVGKPVAAVENAILKLGHIRLRSPGRGIVFPDTHRVYALDDVSTLQTFNDGVNVTDAYIYNAPDVGLEKLLANPIFGAILSMVISAYLGLPPGVTTGAGAVVNQTNAKDTASFLADQQAAAQQAATQEQIAAQQAAAIAAQQASAVPSTSTTGGKPMSDWFDVGSIADSASQVDTSGLFNVGPGAFDFSTLPVSVDYSGVSVPDLGGATQAAGDIGAAVTTDAAGIDWNAVVSNVSQVAIGALKVLPAFIQAGRPSIKVGSTATNPDGSVTTIAANGTMTTHYPNGQTVTKPTAPGQPYFLADGSTVTNNGDGTYTLIRASGQSATMRYSMAASMGDLMSNPVVWGAAGVAAILLLRGR